MKKILVIFLCLTGFFLYAETGTEIYSKAYIEYYQGKYIEAKKLFEKSVDFLLKENNIVTALYAYLYIGQCHMQLEEYEKAIEVYEEMVGLTSQIENKEFITTFYDTFYPSLIDAYYKVAKKFVYIGKYDKAFEYLNNAIIFFKKEKYYHGEILINNYISSIYYNWGKFDLAAEYTENAIKLAKKQNDYVKLSTNYINLGSIYFILGDFNKALNIFEIAIEITKKTNDKKTKASLLNRIGHLNFYLNKMDKAISSCEEALKIAVEINYKEEISISLTKLGFIYMELGKIEAIDYFEKALNMEEELGRKTEIAYIHDLIGDYYYGWSEYKKAIESYNKSIKIKEELRLTAKGNIKRDYLTKELKTYKHLISSYIKQKDYYNAIMIKELSSSKYLAEQISNKNNIIDIKQFQNTLDNTTIIIGYSNLPYGKLGIYTVTKNSIDFLEIGINKKLEYIDYKYDKILQEFIDNEKRGTQKDIEKLYSAYYYTNLDKIVSYYRTFLNNPKNSIKNLNSNDKIKENREVKEKKDNRGLKEKEKDLKDASDYEAVSKTLYELLIYPVSDKLVDKKQIIIIPEGLLAYLPFETLIDESNRFLVENYNIRYIQSLNIYNLIKERKYTKKKNSILAFGGAVYNNEKYNNDMDKIEINRNSTLSEFERGISVKDILTKLGIKKWTNLPGTLEEVKGIKKIYNNANIYTGQDVNEAFIKELSKEKLLNQYEIIHFSTHGFVFPKVPEISSLVLSQLYNTNEDGYLTMNEIIDLDINAAFVNLSACETGLGKIYGGEGVVGLSQAFLISGAKGISVSLWQVADKSTMKFMLELYRNINFKNMSYSEAISDVKKRFINDNKFSEYKSPFYWAPFIFYGLD